jgi:hypothetical protein
VTIPLRMTVVIAMGAPNIALTRVMVTKQAPTTTRARGVSREARDNRKAVLPVSVMAIECLPRLARYC